MLMLEIKKNPNNNLYINIGKKGMPEVFDFNKKWKPFLVYEDGVKIIMIEGDILDLGKMIIGILSWVNFHGRYGQILFNQKSEAIVKEYIGDITGAVLMDVSADRMEVNLNGNKVKDNETDDKRDRTRNKHKEELA